MLSGRRLQIECNFEGTEDYPREAKVVVHRENGDILLRGKTTQMGSFTFRYSELSSFRVVISDQLGHRAVVEISQEKLTQSFRKDIACLVVAGLSTNGMEPVTPVMLLADLAQKPIETQPVQVPPTEDSGFLSFVLRVILGVVILGGIALFALVMKHHRLRRSETK